MILINTAPCQLVIELLSLHYIPCNNIGPDEVCFFHLLELSFVCWLFLTRVQTLPVQSTSTCFQSTTSSPTLSLVSEAALLFVFGLVMSFVGVFLPACQAVTTTGLYCLGGARECLSSDAQVVPPSSSLPRTFCPDSNK